MARRIIPQDQIAAGRKLRAEGRSFLEISRILGMAKSTVERNCRVEGVVRNRDRLTARNKAILVAWNDGNSTEEICSEFCVTPQTISTVKHTARALGLNVRSSTSGDAKIHDADETEINYRAACQGFEDAMREAGGGSYANLSIPACRSIPFRSSGL